MSLAIWLTRNWADTDEGSDPTLVPLELPQELEEAFARIEQAIAGLPRWRIESSDPGMGLLHATRRTRLFRFVDDILLRLEEKEGRTLVHAHSQSRIGKGDFGQNRRNIVQLFEILRR